MRNFLGVVFNKLKVYLLTFFVKTFCLNRIKLSNNLLKMEFRTYLTACAIEHKIDLVEKAIEYMETVPLSTECYNAIVDMLKYEKHGLIEDFKHLECCPNEEEIVEMTKNCHRDDLEFNC